MKHLGRAAGRTAEYRDTIRRPLTRKCMLFATCSRRSPYLCYAVAKTSTRWDVGSRLRREATRPLRRAVAVDLTRPCDRCVRQVRTFLGLGRRGGAYLHVNVPVVAGARGYVHRERPLTVVERLGRAPDRIFVRDGGCHYVATVERSRSAKWVAIRDDRQPTSAHRITPHLKRHTRCIPRRVYRLDLELGARICGDRGRKRPCIELTTSVATSNCTQSGSDCVRS